MESYLNKDAMIIISFGNGGSGGSCPLEVVGKIKKFDSDFIEIEFDPSHQPLRALLKNTSGKMLVNKKYLNSVILL